MITACGPVHAGSVSEASGALRAGADRLAHPPALDTIQSEAFATLLTPHGVSVASTLAISSLSDRHEESQGRRPRYLANVLTNMRLLRRSGVGVALGTNAPMLSVGDAMDLELDPLREAGFSSAEIVQIATRNARPTWASSTRLGLSNRERLPTCSSCAEILLKILRR